MSVGVRSFALLCRYVGLGTIRVRSITPARYASSKANLFTQHVTSSRYQIYVSRSHDPFLNLSLEHYLLQKSANDSIILFLYINRPCVVIGRNQNPWLEVDLSRINRPTPLREWSSSHDSSIRTVTGVVDLVRRRSGGGTVFHDMGNVNYCVICPNQSFTRDKHAEMVVRALRKHFSMRARVNERHDIVLDQGDEMMTSEDPEAPNYVDPRDMHATKYPSEVKPPLKVSGSAYKVVRGRTLHHGTCLVNCANFGVIGGLLRSAAAPHIQALGVDSVRSPVGNVSKNHQPDVLKRFQKGVIEEFCRLYEVEVGRKASELFEEKPDQDEVSEPVRLGDTTFSLLDEGHADQHDITAGIEEMRSLSWIYGQTPRFSLSSNLNGKATGASPIAFKTPPGSSAPHVQLAARQGIIEKASISWLGDTSTEIHQGQLQGQKLWEVDDFATLLSLPGDSRLPAIDQQKARRSIGDWLNQIFSTPISRE